VLGDKYGWSQGAGSAETVFVDAADFFLAAGRSLGESTADPEARLVRAAVDTSDADDEDGPVVERADGRSADGGRGARESDSPP
jgi:hypothetical protein